MEKNNKSHTIISGILKAATWKLTLILLLFVAAVLALYKTIHFISETSSPATITKDEKTSMSLTQIRAIEDIGEWEFLTINDEEIIDTVRHEFVGDAERVRIYYGTLRRGKRMDKGQRRFHHSHASPNKAARQRLHRRGAHTLIHRKRLVDTRRPRSTLPTSRRRNAQTLPHDIEH